MCEVLGGKAPVGWWVSQMAGNIPRVSALVLLALALAATSASSQAPPRGVYLRSTGEEAPHVDQYIAEHALPVELSAQIRESMAEMTPAGVIGSLCGSVRDAYYEAFESRPENAGLRRGEPMGERSQAIVIPACLYVGLASSEDLKTAAGGEAPPVEIVRGERPDRGFNPFRAVLNPLRSTRASIRYVSLRLTGQQTLTIPTFFEPVGMTVEEFVAGVETAARREGVVREATPGEGEIVLGIGETAEGAACEAGPPSFSAQAVLAFYRFARARGAERAEGPARTGDVEVVIVDNGFYGARRSATWDEAWAGSPFPKTLFRPSTEGVLASRLTSRRGDPLNEGEPNTTSGHGTHVTGLAIGGPELAPVSREIFDPHDAGRSWLTITIYNVGNGSRLIDPDTQRDLATALRFGANHRRVVNMSIAFAGLDELAPIYTLMTSDNERPQDLFVVAAGNTLSSTVDRDVQARQIYPASFGGMRLPNVMTVAAHDAAFQLAGFSNYSNHSVDIAAPGCALRSWIGAGDTVVPLSGTSMATPLVTYTAALVASLVEEMPPGEIKRRIVVSGDLLEPPAADNIAFRVRLNTLRSVLLFDDIVELVEAPGVFVGGDIETLSGVRCLRAGFDVRREDLWSLKRGANSVYLYRGRSTDALNQPCQAVLAANAVVSFRERFRIARDGTIQITTHDPRPIPLSGVTSIVQRTRIR